MLIDRRKQSEFIRQYECGPKKGWRRGRSHRRVTRRRKVEYVRRVKTNAKSTHSH